EIMRDRSVYRLLWAICVIGDGCGLATTGVVKDPAAPAGKIQIWNSDLRSPPEHEIAWDPPLDPMVGIDRDPAGRVLGEFPLALGLSHEAATLYAYGNLGQARVNLA